MRQEITPSVEWKLDHAIGVMTQADDVSEYSFNKRVEIFIEQWEDRIRAGESGWADSAVGLRDGSESPTLDVHETTSNRSVPEFEGESLSLELEPDVTRRVEAIAVAENPSVPVGRFSFNDTLLAALEAWNSYATELDTGWTPADSRVTDRA